MLKDRIALHEKNCKQLMPLAPAHRLKLDKYGA